MVETVIVFALINLVFELIVLSQIRPSWRLRIIGIKARKWSWHVVVLLLTLTVHWGTVSGTMSGFLAAIMSLVTMFLARIVWGKVNEENKYQRGLIKYRPQELL